MNSIGEKSNDFITREEYVQMVLGTTCTNCSSFSEETKNEIDIEYSKAPFPDTDISNEYTYCVRDAKNKGIVQGYAQGADFGFFKPQNSISRAEAVKVILETLEIDTSNYRRAGDSWYFSTSY